MATKEHTLKQKAEAPWALTAEQTREVSARLCSRGRELACFSREGVTVAARDIPAYTLFGFPGAGAHLRGQPAFDGFQGSFLERHPAALASDAVALLYADLEPLRDTIAGARNHVVTPALRALVEEHLGRPILHLNVLAEALRLAQASPAAMWSGTSGTVCGAVFVRDPLAAGIEVCCDANVRLGFLADGTILALTERAVAAGERLRATRWPWASGADSDAVNEVAEEPLLRNTPGFGEAMMCTCPKCQGASVRARVLRKCHAGWRAQDPGAYRAAVWPHANPERKWTPLDEHVVMRLLEQADPESLRHAAIYSARALARVFEDIAGCSEDDFVARYEQALDNAQRLRQWMGPTDRALTDLHTGAEPAEGDAQHYAGLASFTENARSPVLRAAAERAYAQICA